MRAEDQGKRVSGSGFVSLIYNAALLLVLVFLYDLLARYFRRRSLAFRLLTGLVLGLISIAVMVTAWRLPSGVIFDTRSVALSMGTLFYGTIPGALGGAIAAAYRVIHGGSGTVMGVSVIAMSVVVGAVWRRWRRVAQRDPGVLELYLFGLTVHVCMLLLTAALPDPLATLQDIAIPVIVIFPLASVLIGLLMIDMRRRRLFESALRESERRFIAFAEHMPGRLWIRDHGLRYLYVNPRLAADLGRTEDQLVGRTPEELWGPEMAAVGRDMCLRALDGEVVDVTERWPDEPGGDHYRSLVFALPSEDGAAEMLGGLMYDITAEHKAKGELSRHAERLSRTLEGAVLAVSQIVEMRDPYTAGHERRVAQLAVEIAAAMGASEEELDGLRLAALIHDVGKVAVPSEILSRPGRLSEIEFTLIKEHAQAGYDILRAIEFEQPIAQIVLQHHERLDGSGYPSGMRGDEILLQSRAIAVADVYEAMTSHRPYRPALPREAAFAELSEGAGVRYDAQAVDACLRLIENGFVFSTQD
jgi:putative nucleotidyltransferase with HDIG domain/PAS domain S-box-containing protein